MKLKLAELNRSLQADYGNIGPAQLRTDNQLRILIGVLGMLMPLLLWLFVFWQTGLNKVLPSISHYYFTHSNPIFITIVSFLGIFLFSYRGYARIDTIISSIAGFFALCLLLFPTGNLCSDECKMTCCQPDYAIASVNPDSGRELFHYISAALFLFCLALMSLLLFSRAGKEPSSSRTKSLQRATFMACGIGMILAMAVILYGSVLEPSASYDANHLTFWMETVAVELFGISWMVKWWAKRKPAGEVATF